MCLFGSLFVSWLIRSLFIIGMILSCQDSFPIPVNIVFSNKLASCNGSSPWILTFLIFGHQPVNHFIYCSVLFSDPVAVRHSLEILSDLATKDPYAVATALGNVTSLKFH